jgi:hypothetical protein
MRSIRPPPRRERIGLSVAEAEAAAEEEAEEEAAEEEAENEELPVEEPKPIPVSEPKRAREKAKAPEEQGRPSMGPLIVTRSLGQFSKTSPVPQLQRHLKWEHSNQPKGKVCKPLMSVRSIAHRPHDHNPIQNDEVHAAVAHLM